MALFVLVWFIWVTIYPEIYSFPPFIPSTGMCLFGPFASLLSTGICDLQKHLNFYFLCNFVECNLFLDSCFKTEVIKNQFYKNGKPHFMIFETLRTLLLHESPKNIRIHIPELTMELKKNILFLFLWWYVRVYKHMNKWEWMVMSMTIMVWFLAAIC